MVALRRLQGGDELDLPDRQNTQIIRLRCASAGDNVQPHVLASKRSWGPVELEKIDGLHNRGQQ